MKAAGSDIIVTLTGDEGTTGNFEITYKGKLLFSKQKDKVFPTDDALASVVSEVAPPKPSAPACNIQYCGG